MDQLSDDRVAERTGLDFVKKERRAEVGSFLKRYFALAYEAGFDHSYDHMGKCLRLTERMHIVILDEDSYLSELCFPEDDRAEVFASLLALYICSTYKPPLWKELFQLVIAAIGS